MTNRIQPRTGVAVELSVGDLLTVIDPEGSQVSDLVAVSRRDPREILSNGRTFDYEETIRLTTGARLWSNRSNPMLSIVEDTVGLHDFLLTPCSQATFEHFYPDEPVHRGCFGNLAAALEPYGVEPDGIPTAFNVFMNVPLAKDGRLTVEPPKSTAGDFIRFRAEMNLIVGLTACSAYASNGGSFKPIDYAIERV
ncbi:MAG: urea carboxylase-associated family protein [Erythrobacter sp.]|uniref:urea carboxylase-associated family protein n=1 Tax=Erythrobacter sp. TaxID=1042 RepID=UPI001B2E27F6|nr:urea carboxylase-associated family protein [Erythrobacter sp.]MBO6768229.1 urea carboxylase-associated family protein [Erythrobacter sp.]